MVTIICRINKTRRGLSNKNENGEKEKSDTKGNIFMVNKRRKK